MRFNISKFILLSCIISEICFFFLIYSKELTFQMIHERAEITFVDTSYVNFSLQVRKYNRTTKTLSASFIAYRTVTDKAMVKSSGYLMRSNEYQYVGALEQSVRLKTVMSFPILDIPTILANFEPPLKWPIKTNVTYTLQDWIPNTKSFPIMQKSEGKWKVVLHLCYDENIKVGEIIWYLEIKLQPNPK